eukprot:9478416-Ditylum_brightwellii.AAC.1
MEDLLQDLIVFKASSDLDTLYHRQAMAVSDIEEFKAVIVIEVSCHIDNKYWELIPTSQAHREAEMLESVPYLPHLSAPTNSTRPM